MSSKPKILFVYDNKYPDFLIGSGLWAALDELEKDFEILRLNLWEHNQKVAEKGVAYLTELKQQLEQYNFYLGWGAFGSSVDNYLQHSLMLLNNQKRGLCIAGNAFRSLGATNYDVLFYETKWYRPQINFHPNIVQAFGVNTDIYFPITDIPTPIIWDYIGVGAFAEWKRWEKMIDKPGKKLVIGEYQVDNEIESSRIAQNLIKHGVMVSNMVHPFDLANLYHYSRTLYVPADINGGGERAILEARACGLKVEIEDDNEKLKELVEMETIVSHIDYANKIREGVLSVL